ncbi:MAG: helix-turn-helix transcriptional regulator [Synergistaceae bacterium]|nr:helix-turn-helix transcriptional regulator [Synergistaceae bacterium]
MTERNCCDGTGCAEKCPCMEQCPLQGALARIGGKWKIPILCALHQDGATRYNTLKRKISGITNTMLASSLKELENDRLVRRVQYMEMPVRVEYSLTENCAGLMPILVQLAGWGSAADVAGRS